MLPASNPPKKKTFALYARILISRKNTTTKRDGFIHTILCVSCYFGCASALKFFNKDSEIKNARTTPQKTVKLLSPQDISCVRLLCMSFRIWIKLLA